jgi:hypothetical protein
MIVNFLKHAKSVWVKKYLTKFPMVTTVLTELSETKEGYIILTDLNSGCLEATFALLGDQVPFCRFQPVHRLMLLLSIPNYDQ